MVAVATRPAGCRGMTASARFAAPLSRGSGPGRWSRSPAPPGGATRRPRSPPRTASPPTCRTGRRTTPSAGGPPGPDRCRHATRHGRQGHPRRLGVDGGRVPDDGRGTGSALRQAGVERKGNGIPAVRDLAGSPGVTGRTVTMDATRTRHGIADRGHGRPGHRRPHRRGTGRPILPPRPPPGHPRHPRPGGPPPLIRPHGQQAQRAARRRGGTGVPETPKTARHGKGWPSKPVPRPPQPCRAACRTDPLREESACRTDPPSR